MNRSTTLPPWLIVRLSRSPGIERLKAALHTQGLVTVCQEARCPNLSECWAGGTATLMLMGEVCTRGCRFCHVTSGNPQGWLDPEEPAKVAQTVATGGWSYVVLTSVDRDDLPDGGASHWVACIEAIRQHCPETLIEALIPDYQDDNLRQLACSGVTVLAHNLETVARLTASVRDRRATYERSLAVLEQAKCLNPALITKSSLMLGLGETEPEVRQALRDLRAVGAGIVTLGQYLQPSARHLPVVRYVPPEEFEQWQRIATDELGFEFCAAGPLVRSSYKAAEAFVQRQAKPD